MPIAIITDTHFGCKGFAKSVFEMQMQFFEKQFFPYLLKHGIKDVLHGGDIVHNRNMMDLYILQELKRRFFKWFDDNDVNLHVIVGNHDSYYKNTIEYNFLNENVTEFKNVHVYSKQTKLKLGKYTIGMVPWVTDEENEELPKGVDIVLGHFDIKSFIMMKGVYSSEGYDYTLFKDYKLVISGHYHIKSQRENIHYVGSQYQLSWGDYELDKGFMILDDTFKLKFIQNTVSPRFVKIFYNEVDGNVVYHVRGDGKSKGAREITAAEALIVASKNYCKIVIEKQSDQVMFDSFFTSIQARSRDNYKIELIDANEIVESFDFEEIEERIREESDTFSTINTFIGGMAFEPDIDKESLVSYMRELYKEAEEFQNTIQTQKEALL